MHFRYCGCGGYKCEKCNCEAAPVCLRSIIKLLLLNKAQCLLLYLLFSVLSFIIPALYTGIISHASTKRSTNHDMNWFLNLQGSQFQAFLSMNLIFITIYLVLFVKLVKSLKGGKTENPVKKQHHR